MGSDALGQAQTPCPSVVTEAYYTLQQAAQLVGVPVADLERAMAEHRLPFVHQFGRKLIAPDDLDAYRIQNNLPNPHK